MLKLQISEISKVCSCPLPPSAEAYAEAVSGIARRERRAGMAVLCSLLEEVGVLDFNLETDGVGKPFLTDSPYFFNISHSGDFCAAVLSDKPVGIDLQTLARVNRIRDINAFAKRFFSPDELELFLKKPTREELCALWTRKEALSKLLGRQLCESLSSLSSLNFSGVDFETKRLELKEIFYLTVAVRQERIIRTRPKA